MHYTLRNLGKQPVGRFDKELWSGLATQFAALRSGTLVELALSLRAFRNTGNVSPLIYTGLLDIFKCTQVETKGGCFLMLKELCKHSTVPGDLEPLLIQRLALIVKVTDLISLYYYYKSKKANNWVRATPALTQ